MHNSNYRQQLVNGVIPTESHVQLPLCICAAFYLVAKSVRFRECSYTVRLCRKWKLTTRTLNLERSSAGNVGLAITVQPW